MISELMRSGPWRVPGFATLSESTDISAVTRWPMPSSTVTRQAPLVSGTKAKQPLRSVMPVWYSEASSSGAKTATSQYAMGVSSA